MGGISPARAALLLFFLFFLGFAVTLLAFVDLHWTHRLLVQDAAGKSSQSLGQPRQELP